MVVLFHIAVNFLLYLITLMMIIQKSVTNQEAFNKNLPSFINEHEFFILSDVRDRLTVTQDVSRNIH
jgi:hypothetical protein